MLISGSGELRRLKKVVLVRFGAWCFFFSLRFSFLNFLVHVFLVIMTSWTFFDCPLFHNWLALNRANNIAQISLLLTISLFVPYFTPSAVGSIFGNTPFFSFFSFLD